MHGLSERVPGDALSPDREKNEVFSLEQKGYVMVNKKLIFMFVFA